VLPVVRDTPVLAGVNGTDPFRLMPVFLRELKAMGFDGVQNFPTVGLFDGRIRAYCEETGFGYGLEVDMIREAHALDMLTCPYVFDEDEARAMTNAGADVLVPHMGTTVKGTIARASDTRCSRKDSTRHSGAVPRRPHRRTGGRAIYLRPYRRHRRLFRRLQYRTPFRRASHRSPNTRLQRTIFAS
jgi:predicted TIM-barrel enzyme